MKRIVSLLPSATEALCLIPGGKAMLVGRSHECDFPKDIAHLPILTAPKFTGTEGSEAIDTQVKETLSSGQSLYHLDEAKLQELQPDVILTQDLCAVCSIDLQTVERVAQRMQPQPLVVSLNPKSLGDVLEDVLKVGAAVGIETEAQAAHKGLQDRIDAVVAKVKGLPQSPAPEVAFFEWMAPIFVGGHWTPELIELAGGRHSLNGPGKHSPETPPQKVVDSQPDAIIICPCGYDIAATRKEVDATLVKQEWWQELPAVQSGRVVVVDGNQMFNRSGPRLVECLEWLAGWVHNKPEWIPEGFPVEPL